MEDVTVFWTDYMEYRLKLRGYDRARVEDILRYSSEKYLDTVTGRIVAVGQHMKRLVMIPYEREGGILTPVTIHATNRQQINSRLKSGRFKNE
jgi:hypothetical protein